MAVHKVKLAQSTQGSWSHIDILVDGIKRFHATKRGTNFWIIVKEDDRTQVIGFGTGRVEVLAIITAYLSKA